jgi:hypothetical protein
VESTIKTAPEEFQLRFYGEGVSPTSIPVHELSEVLNALDSTIRSIVIDSDAHAEGMSLFLVQVTDESLGLRVVSNYAAKAALAFSLVSSAVQSQVYSGIPEKSITEFEKIIRFTQKHNCNGEINGFTNGTKTTLATITPETEIKREAEIKISGKTSIFAYVQWAGGKTPRIHLMLPDERYLSCKAERELIKKLRIYDWYSFDGDAEWDAVNDKLVSFKVSDVTHRDNPSSLKAFDQISQQFHHVFGDQSPEEFFNDMRYGD